MLELHLGRLRWSIDSGVSVKTTERACRTKATSMAGLWKAWARPGRPVANGKTLRVTLVPKGHAGHSRRHCGHTHTPNQVSGPHIGHGRSWPNARMTWPDDRRNPAQPVENLYGTHSLTGGRRTCQTSGRTYVPRGGMADWCACVRMHIEPCAGVHPNREANPRHSTGDQIAPYKKQVPHTLRPERLSNA